MSHYAYAYSMFDVMLTCTYLPDRLNTRCSYVSPHYFVYLGESIAKFNNIQMTLNVTETEMTY